MLMNLIKVNWNISSPDHPGRTVKSTRGIWDEGWTYHWNESDVEEHVPCWQSTLAHKSTTVGDFNIPSIQIWSYSFLAYFSFPISVRGFLIWGISQNGWKTTLGMFQLSCKVLSNNWNCRILFVGNLWLQSTFRYQMNSWKATMVDLRLNASEKFEFRFFRN